ncbi:MAG TPA: hypothetical protein VFD52_02705 [Clostridia bacterium]|nr:hypothetical protein [Clostridia bacterium]
MPFRFSPYCEAFPFPPSPAPKCIPGGHSWLKGDEYKMLKQYKDSYIYMNVGDESFWMYPVMVTDIYIIGYKWSGFKWKYVRIDVNNINSIF